MTQDNLSDEFESYASLIRVRKAINEAMVTPQDALTWAEQIAKIAGLAQQAKGLADKADQIAISEIITELREELVSVRNKWVDSQEEVLALAEENLVLKQKIKALEDSIIPIDDLTMGDDGLFYKDGVDRPYCPGCYSQGQKESPLQTVSGQFAMLGEYRCLVCDKYLGKSSL